jgi:pimeloyl-ACP methyl ester carboxylesterase
MGNLYGFLGRDHTYYLVGLKPGLPAGYSMRDMAGDYATTIRQEFGRPVDVIGISTGGSIALHLAADHPDVVRRLVIHSSAHTLRAAARDAQLGVARLAQQGRWTEAYELLLGFFLSPRSAGRLRTWLASRLLSLGAPQDPSDLVVTVEAEDRHNFKDRLGEIAAPTLVVAGAEDPGYTARRRRASPTAGSSSMKRWATRPAASSLRGMCSTF